MNDTQIKTFLTVAECMSFTEASYRLYTAQSAVSRTVSTMEQELGYPLFVRLRKEIRLTPAGEVMKNGLSVLYQNYNDLIKQAERASNYVSGTLAIGFLDGQFLDPDTQRLLIRMEQDYPNFKSHMLRDSFGNLIELLNLEQLDVIFVMDFSVQEHSGLLSKPICSLQHRLLVHKDHPLLHKSDLTLYDFHKEPFISIRTDDCPNLSTIIEEICLRAGFSPKIVEAENLSSALLRVELGQGLGIFNEHCSVCRSPMLVPLSFPEIQARDLVLVWSPRNSNPFVEKLLAYL